MAVRRTDHGVVGLAMLWLPVVAVMAAIFYFSSLPRKDIPSLFPLQDVFFHGMIYAVLAWFFKRALKHTCPHLSAATLVIVTVFFGLAYGASDEFHQLFTPGRTAGLEDVITDAVGSFLGSVIYR
jgi:VanZ family protein